MRRRDQNSYLSIALFYRLKDLVSTFLLFKGIPGQPGHDGEPGDRVSIYRTCIFKHQYCYDCAISNWMSNFIQNYIGFDLRGSMID